MRRGFALLSIMLAVELNGAVAQVKYKAPLNEVVRLPEFCWAQYMDVQGPKYSITNCGVRMNHYCPGLLELQRAKKIFGEPQKMRQARSHLVAAHRETLYTLRGMAEYPNCPIRRHVEATSMEVEAMLKAVEEKLQPAPPPRVR